MPTRSPAKKRSTTPWSQVRRPETPERRARVAAAARAMADAERLAAIRTSRGVTQVQLAEKLGIAQGNVSALERRDDVYLSTLREYVEALGGRLEISAVFDDEDRHSIAIGA